ncbi:hypothetical protein AK812_SmicGene33198 [Symbiodinium microadriaticum]|uniref:CCHC-type domain-containing protein n=1 Tax=Symbiodinium microadriaticum TaxID=2951 RepID=A0A1Q9CS84_SYMMI|nr:hypothetical protein AK812_SmicGene33198 [Symbiodinium microadriaticum]
MEGRGRPSYYNIGDEPGFVEASPVQVPPQPTVESVLLHTVQQQQNQVAQLTSLVQTLVSRESTARAEKGKGVGELSDITDSTNRAMEVDEGGAPIRNPKAEAYVPKLPAIDGTRMSKGRRSEIEGWADFLEQFLPWIALFDDRIPEELHRAMVAEAVIKQSVLDKGQSVRSTRTFLYLKQALQNFPRGIDIVKQVEKEQLGSPAGYECVRRLHQELSVGSRIEASTLRTEILQFKTTTPGNRPLDCFRNVQLEMSRYGRLTGSFPDLALTEADKCMVALQNLDSDIKRYVLLHARIDSLDQLETAIKFFDSNLKILQFSEKSSRKGEHANALSFEKNKGKWDNKGKDKGKGDTKGKEKGKEGKGKGDKGKEGKSGKEGKDKGKGGAAKDKGKGNPGNKGDNKDKEKEERLKNIKCYNCDQYGHYSNKCPKPKREKASAATLLEPQVAAVSLEPQLFAVALECPVVALDSEDSCSDLSEDDWGDFVSAYESSWLDPEVALEGGEPVVVLGDSGVAPVELEDIPVELAEPLEFSHGIPVELAEPIEFFHGIPVELGCHHEESCRSHEHGMVAHETALASTQQHAMDWWLVDSGASAHIVNEETLQRLHVVSISDSASECISATGDSIGVRRMGRKNPGDSSSSSGEPEWRLAGKSHLVKADAMSSTKVVRDFEDSLVAVTGTSMIGTEKANNVILVPADDAKVKERRAVAKAKAIAAAQKVAEQITKKREKERAEKIAAEEAQWAKEAEEVQKKRKKTPEPTGSSKAPEPTGSSKAPESTGSKAPEPTGSSKAPEPSRGSKGPDTKKMPNPPKTKAMPVAKGSMAKVRKVCLKPRRPGVPDKVFRQVAEKKLQGKKQGYLARTIARAMKKDAGDSPQGAPVRRTWAEHFREHQAKVMELEADPFVVTTVSEVVREPNMPPPARLSLAKAFKAGQASRAAAAAAEKEKTDRIEGPGYSFPAPPSVPPRRRLPTPPRAPITPEVKAMPRSQKNAPETPSEVSWSVVSNPPGTEEVKIEGIVYNLDDLGTME